MTFFSSRTLPGKRYVPTQPARRETFSAEPRQLAGEFIEEVPGEHFHVALPLMERRQSSASKVSRLNRSGENSRRSIICRKSRLVAAITRAEVFNSSAPPTRVNVPYSTHGGSSPGRHGHVADLVQEKVPPSARSNAPCFTLSAPVNAPFSCPNNSLSSSALFQAVQFRCDLGRPAAPRQAGSPGRPTLCPSTLTDNQNRPRYPGHTSNLLEQPPHGGGAAYQMKPLLQGFTQLGVLFVQPAVTIHHIQQAPQFPQQRGDPLRKLFAHTRKSVAPAAMARPAASTLP